MNEADYKTRLTGGRFYFGITLISANNNDFGVADLNEMTSQPKVSVLVPVYNGEKYLAECLDSVLAQDFANMEILIADDGSTDGSRELIRHYAEKDSRIRWWRNPANLGLAGNFNACLRAARNDYIKYVLQDDVCFRLRPSGKWRRRWTPTRRCRWWPRPRM